MQQAVRSWQLAEPAQGVSLCAEVDGVWLRGRGVDLNNLHSRPLRDPKTRLGRLLPILIPQLLELDLATVEGGGVRIPYADFTALEAHGIDAFEGVVPWAPFTIELEASGSLGFAGFRYAYRFYL